MVKEERNKTIRIYKQTTMLGAIIGDIVGSRFEFNNTRKRNFKLFTKECEFTDDTVCTVAVADAIAKGINYRDSLLNWCNRYPHPKGSYGASFAHWLASDNPQPYNSFGNGSAMRVAPVAWAFDDLQEVKRQAKKTASVTHNHPEGIKGAVAVAHGIYVLRKTHDLKCLRDAMLQYYPTFVDVQPTGTFDETCQGTVPLCLKVVVSSTSFEDAIRNAISCGGDSDTIGAIVGSMAEAIWDIPGTIIDTAFDYLPIDILNAISDFFHFLNNRKHA